MSVVTPKAALLFQYSGKKVPEGLFDAALTNNSHVSIAMSLINGENSQVLVLKHKVLDMPDPLKSMLTIQDKASDRDVTFFFQNLEKDEVNQQPFTLLVNAKDKPMAVAFLESIEDVEEAVKDHFGPIMLEQFTNSGMDLERLDKILQGKTAGNALTARCGETGAATILLGIGKLLQFGPKKGEDFDWGFATETYGWKDGAKPITGEIEPEVPAQKSLEDKLNDALGGTDTKTDQTHKVANPTPDSGQKLSKVTEHPMAKKKREAEEAAAKAKAAEPKKHDGPPAVQETENHIMISPPADLRDPGSLTGWCLKECETIPKDHWKLYKTGKLRIPVLKSKIKQDSKRYAYLGKDILGALAGVAADSGKIADKNGTIAKAQANTGMSHLAQAEAKIPGPKLPLLEPATRKDIQNKFIPDVNAKYVDKSDQDVEYPPFLKKYDDKHPSFAMQLGLPSIMATAHWEYEQLIQFGKDYGIEALALKDHWAMHELLLTKQKLQQLERKQREATASTEPVVKEHPMAARRRGVAA